ncbi:hypothetical protein [Nonomuraea jabiensis]|uniref:hypothetical protein n=1 Tax=Nonomuraea jabiensis TaxID=882448 RepID=UPI003D75E1E0
MTKHHNLDHTGDHTSRDIPATAAEREPHHRDGFLLIATQMRTPQIFTPAALGAPDGAVCQSCTGRVSKDGHIWQNGSAERYCDPCARNLARETNAQVLAGISKWKASMVGGYDDDAVNTVLGSISEVSGLHLMCVWDYYDEYGPGGDSDFYVESDDGSLHYLAGDLYEWLSVPPDSEDAPEGPGDPTTWVGGPADIGPDDIALQDDQHNYALQDRQ